MAESRLGSYGVYYGSSYDSSTALTSEEMKVNATYIYSYLNNKGWSINSISAILGNMERESSLNPGRWQSDNVGNLSGGYGLVQWTPATNYINWVNGDPSEMNNNLDRIMYELDNNLQWITTDDYPLSFKDFTTSNESIDYLTMAFLKNYERAGVEAANERIEAANKWKGYLTGISPDDPSNPFKKKKKFNFIIFNRRRRFI